LSAEQRPAHLVFWYESEVQNGGHFQYFENRGTEHLAATIEALGFITHFIFLLIECFCFIHDAAEPRAAGNSRCPSSFV
jgi:hypothetical protein